MLVTEGKTQVYKHHRRLKLEWGLGGGENFNQESTILLKQEKKRKQNKTNAS